MGRGVRLSKIGMGLLAVSLAVMPAAAQNVVVPNNDGPPPTEIVGPPQLRDFNLNGTVTRPASPQPVPRNAPAETPPPARSVTTSPTTPSAQPQRQANRATPAETAIRSEPPSAPLPAPSPRVESSPPAGISQQAPPAAVEPAPVAALPDVPLPGEAGGEFDLWPWLLAALAAAAGGLIMFRRNQQRNAFAGALAGGPALDFEASPEPSPEPLRRAPVAVPPPRPASTGIVSTRLRPDLAISLLPERAVVDETGATIEFQVALRNNGTAPAREILLEACIVNAGPAQDQELGAFFAHPAGSGDTIPQIMPMTEITLKSAVRLPPEQMRQYEIQGRKLFVPLVGVNAVYRGPGGRAQTSASYLVGRDGNGEKMAPFRLDLGPRIFRGLGAREHTMGLRT